jgi:hypothetical protein
MSVSQCQKYDNSIKSIYGDFKFYEKSILYCLNKWIYQRYSKYLKSDSQITNLLKMGLYWIYIMF